MIIWFFLLQMAARALKREEREVVSHTIEDLTEPGSDPNESSLWVDKYRPRGYMDLLSDEVIEILRIVKTT